jgi:HJR/Mrr/RecB family endonuclease
MTYLESIVNQIVPKIIGAGQSIDIVIDYESFLKDGILEDFLLLTDERLIRRLIISGFPPKEALSFLKKFKFMQTKEIDTKVGIDLVIIDRAEFFCINKFIEDLKSYPIPVYYTSEKYLVKEQIEFFDYLWSQSSQVILYNELVKIHKPNLFESIYYGSKTLRSNIINELKKDPNLVFKIPPNEFEKLIEFLLNNMGYQTFRTPRTKDGGKDILAKFLTPDGYECLCLVECKRFAPNKKVAVDIVRSLFGVVQDQKANLGMIVTTSTYTKYAQDFQERHQHTLSLRDFEDLKTWIKNTSS